MDLDKLNGLYGEDNNNKLEKFAENMLKNIDHLY